jgi:hypothetical protein
MKVWSIKESPAKRWATSSDQTGGTPVQVIILVIIKLALAILHLLK